MKDVEKAARRSAVLTEAVIRAAECLGLKRNELAAVIGVSPATLSRMYSGQYVLEEQSKSWELASLLVKLYRGLDASMASDERSVRDWMRNPNTDLHDTPTNLISSVIGLSSVVAYVDVYRARV